MKKLSVIALMIFILAACLLLGARAYLQNNPRSYEMISHKITHLAQNFSEDYDISFDPPIISFNNQIDSVKIILPNVKVKAHEGVFGAAIPQLELYPSIVNLLFGRVYLNEVKLENPVISAPNFTDIIKNKGNFAGNVNVKKIEVNNLVLTGTLEKELDIEYLSIIFQNYIVHDSFEIHLKNKDEEMRGKVIVNPFSKIVDFDIDSKRVSFHSLIPEILDINLIADFEVKGEFDYKNKRVNYLKLNKLDSKIGENGGINAEFEIDGKKIIKASLEMIEIPVNQLGKLWPKNVIPEIRHWTIERIKTAKITGARFDLNVLHGRNNIEGMANFVGLSYCYDENMPIIEDVVGSFSVDENSVNIKFNQGKIHNSSITGGVEVDYHEGIKIDTELTGDLESIVAYIPKDIIKNLRDVDLFFDQLEGNAVTDARIFIPYKDNFEFNDIEFDIYSKFKNLKLENLPGNISLKDGSFDAIFKGHKLNIKGNGYIGGKNTDIIFTSDFEDMENVKNNLTIAATLPAEVAKDIRVFGEEIVKSGVVDVKFTYNDDKTKNNLKLNVDFSKAFVKIEKFGFTKNADEALKLEMNSAKGNGKLLNLNNIKLTGENIDIAGNAKFNVDSLAIAYIKLNHVKFGKNNFAMESDEKHNTKIYGEAVDLENVNFGKLANNNSLSPNKSSFNIKLDKAYMKNGVVFDKVNGNLECDIKGCFKGEMTAFSGENMSKLTLTNNSNLHSDLVLSSKDASSVLRAFNIYTKIRGGQLQLKGKKNMLYSKSNPEVTADISITNFKAVKNNVLTRILTVSSVPGIVGLLSKNEIPFEKFHTEINYNNGILKLEHGVVEGGQLGLTIEGNVDMLHERLDLKGTVIPDLYFINKAISSIPLLGKMLEAGGHKGVFAANYRVEGTYDKVSTTVNPFSILTPGFTREVFGIFDVKKEKEE